ncbi:MAG: TldD/PmbA family protein [Bacteroidales bacterium]|nr:TldD/PmbA family protein [Bacteroidales bacterium]
MRIISSILTGILIIVFIQNQCIAQSSLIRIMKAEMEHEMNSLSKQEYPAYFMEYKIFDQYSLGIQASFGSVLTANIDSSRSFTAAVRLGSYKMDNTHALPEGSNPMLEPSQVMLPWTYDEQILRLEMWNATAYAYERSKDQYKQVLDARDDEGFKQDVDDFTKADALVYYEEVPESIINKSLLDEWKLKCSSLSSQFLEDTSFMAGTVFFATNQNRQHLVTSEGQEISQNKQSCMLMIMGLIRTTDNQLAVDMLTYSVNDPSELKSIENIRIDLQQMITRMKLMKDAPIAQPYSGPALLSPQAAGVFFHEIFGHRVEGHRLADMNDSQTFGDKLGKTVLPKYISISFDPTSKDYKGQHLTGSYKYDDEGILAKKVKVVENGVLQDFLMSRKPVKGFNQSNGHGRAMIGSGAVSRQSNMIVESEKTYNEAELRKKLISECKRQKKEYGYYFKQVSGGLTLNSVYMANVFTVFPTEIYRVYADGRPDEMVRQVSLIGTPLTMFSEIEAAGDDSELFPGFCGAESGSIPVTIVCPSFFVKKIETQKTPEFHVEKPFLVQPSATTISSN